ncbi:hypothetical protein BOTBODRAFT_34651, partial [Botryobasidium botryosum FD-172 SS1]
MILSVPTAFLSSSQGKISRSLQEVRGTDLYKRVLSTTSNHQLTMSRGGFDVEKIHVPQIAYSM